jgi:SepF-like predicted cell division protein (DUF552 family)
VPRSVKHKLSRQGKQLNDITEVLNHIIEGEPVVLKLSGTVLTLSVTIGLINYLKQEQYRLQENLKQLEERVVTFTPSKDWEEYISKKEGWK